MDIILTIVLLLVIVILAAFGAWRGVVRGLLALAGTLFAAVLIDIWQTSWADWVRSGLRVETPDLFTWLLISGVFVTVVAVIGYGSSLLIPDQLSPDQPTLRERASGALLGGFNGLLIVSYLLHYTGELQPQDGIIQIMEASTVAAVLRSWLPWFTLTVVVLTGTFILMRGAVRLYNVGKRPQPQIQSAGTADAAGQKPVVDPVSIPVSNVREPAQDESQAVQADQSEQVDQHDKQEQAKKSALSLFGTKEKSL